MWYCRKQGLGFWLEVVKRVHLRVDWGIFEKLRFWNADVRDFYFSVTSCVFDYK